MTLRSRTRGRHINWFMLRSMMESELVQHGNLQDIGYWHDHFGWRLTTENVLRRALVLTDQLEGLWNQSRSSGPSRRRCLALPLNTKEGKFLEFLAWWGASECAGMEIELATAEPDLETPPGVSRVISKS